MALTTEQNDFSSRILQWFDDHGRKHLPWQSPITPYRVWLSEIMLQQTQVDTVIPYFENYIKTYPTIHALANAPIDEVLHLWTGLGYYARCRNLHKCAKIIVEQYKGEFPQTVETLITLPGIGRSTAAAICSIAFEKPTAILDGNVKRVLARHHAVPGWPGKPKIEKQLWAFAEQHMPTSRCRDYTQAMMDIGATLCTRSKPMCFTCPISTSCIAQTTDDPTQFPGKKPKKALPVKSTLMLIAQHNDAIFLQQRPPTGIWGGLWSLPEFDSPDRLHAYVFEHFKTEQLETLSPIRHTFSHYHLDITPMLVRTNRISHRINDVGHIWYTLNAPEKVGLAAPVKKLLNSLI